MIYVYIKQETKELAILNYYQSSKGWSYFQKYKCMEDAHKDLKILVDKHFVYSRKITFECPRCRYKGSSFGHITCPKCKNIIHEMYIPPWVVICNVSSL